MNGLRQPFLITWNDLDTFERLSSIILLDMPNLVQLIERDTQIITEKCSFQFHILIQIVACANFVSLYMFAYLLLDFCNTWNVFTVPE